MHHHAKLNLLICSSFWLATAICSGNAFGQGTTVPNAVSQAKNQIAYLTPSPSLQYSREAADAAYQAMNYESALEQYKTISQSAGANVDDIYWVGESYFHLRRFDEAAKSFETVIERNPRNEKVRVRVVQTYMSANQPQIAKQKCSEYLVATSDPSVKQQLQYMSKFCDNNIRFRTEKRSLPVGQHGLER